MAAVFLSSWWVKAALCTACVHCLESAGTWSNLDLAVPRSGAGGGSWLGHPEGDTCLAGLPAQPVPGGFWEA